MITFTNDENPQMEIRTLYIVKGGAMCARDFKRLKSISEIEVNPLFLSIIDSTELNRTHRRFSIGIDNNL